ncbi:MAG: polysaccharide deacetylase family protein [Synergistaceae bacterium]|nr:polysaccharide deacetylase family protein [Synergistaceae bacterium]
MSHRRILLSLLALFLCVEHGPLGAERRRWGIASGDPFVKEIVLTFDDGPRERGMQELMAVLGERDVHATFFLVGKFAERYAPITRSLAEAGHEIANHTYTHPKLWALWVEKIMREAERCDEVLEALGLPRTRFLRPPGGSFNVKVFNAMRRMGLRLGLWSINSADYTGRPTEEIVRSVLRGARPGAIVLMHSGVPNTVAALPEIIDGLRAMGYRFVRLEELWDGGAI